MVDRLEHTRRILRRRGLCGLIVTSSSHKDSNIAPFLSNILELDSRTAEPFGFGRSWLFVGLSGGLVVMPDSPWELGEVRRAGVHAVDPRRVAFPIEDGSIEDGLAGDGLARRYLAFAAHCGSSQGQVGIAGTLPSEILTNPRFGSGRGDEKAPTELAGRDLPESLPSGQRTSHSPARLVLADDIPALIRRTKTSKEMHEIQRVAKVSDRAFRAVAKVLAAGVVDRDGIWLGGTPITIGTIRAAVESVFRSTHFAGEPLTEPEGNLIVAGPLAAEPHGMGENSRRIRPGECLVVDLFPKGELFSDCTRTFCVGRPGASGTEELREAASRVAEVKCQVERTLTQRLAKNGSASAFELQTEACETFHGWGWNTQLHDATSNVGYIHGLGHGVGYELHEAPLFSAVGSGTPEGEIRVGDVITIEPGLYRPKSWGIRFEDLFAVEELCGGGASLKKLTNLPWALDPKEFLALAAAGSNDR